MNCVALMRWFRTNFASWMRALAVSCPSIVCVKASGKTPASVWSSIISIEPHEPLPGNPCIGSPNVQAFVSPMRMLNRLLMLHERMVSPDRNCRR